MHNVFEPAEASGVALTIIRPPWSRMKLDIPIEFASLPGATEVTMPVSGQFPARVPEEFVAAVLRLRSTFDPITEPIATAA